MIFIIKGFQTIVFIFIVISTFTLVPSMSCSFYLDGLWVLYHGKEETHSEMKS